MLLVITSAGSTLSRAACQSPARSFSLSCTTPHVTPVNSLWGLHLWHGHNLKPQKHQALNFPTSPRERNRGGGLQRGKRGLEERSGRKSQPVSPGGGMPGESPLCSGVGLSLSPATSSSAGVSTPQLQRQQSCKTRPVFAQDIASLSVPIPGRCCHAPPARQGW